MNNEIRFSERAAAYPASGIRRMFNLAAQHPDAIKLTVGEPNFETPEYVKEAAKKAIDAGETHYTPNAGIAALREAVAAKYHKYWDGYTAGHVIVTVGAMEGLMLSMMTLLNPGDEILVPDPCFPNYFGQAQIVGATPQLPLVWNIPAPPTVSARPFSWAPRQCPCPPMRNMSTGCRPPISKRPLPPIPRPSC